MYMGMFNCTPNPKFVPNNSLVCSNDVPIIYILELYPKFMASSDPYIYVCMYVCNSLLFKIIIISIYFQKK
jgi:hypothetical protein